MNSSSNNPGHIACLLVKKVFSRTFSLRAEERVFQVSGRCERELESRRKHIIQRYVTYFRSEVRDPLVWRDRVVNQFIERPLKKKNSNAPTREEEHKEEMNQETEDHIPTVGPLRALLYTDL